MNFSNLKEIRKDNDVLQKDIAKELGIEKDTYSKYESGGAIPSLETVYNFSKYFSYNIDYVLGLKEKRERAKYKDFDKKLIANNLRSLRESRDYSQTGLGNRLKITQSAIYRYEKALSNPSLNILYKYIKLFEIDFHTLCTKKLYK